MDLSNWDGENKSSFKTTYHVEVPTAVQLLLGRRRANCTIVMEFLHPNAIEAGAKEANSSFQSPSNPGSPAAQCPSSTAQTLPRGRVKKCAIFTLRSFECACPVVGSSGLDLNTNN